MRVEPPRWQSVVDVDEVLKPESGASSSGYGNPGPARAEPLTRHAKSYEVYSDGRGRSHLASEEMGFPRSSESTRVTRRSPSTSSPGAQPRLPGASEDRANTSSTRGTAEPIRLYDKLLEPCSNEAPSRWVRKQQQLGGRPACIVHTS